MRLLTLAVLLALLLPGCAAPQHSSEREWRRAQCGQINDEEMRKKCERRVEDEYGRR